MEFLPPLIDQYCDDHTSNEGEILKEIVKETYQKVLMPRMVSGKLQGQVLKMLSYMIAPKSILEIGTFTGYSAICLAAGLQKGGKLITIDINEELEEMVKKYIHNAGMQDIIEQKIGNALTIIPTLNQSFDLVFIDADKSNYSAYYDMVISSMKPNSYIIADNVLWSGHVVDDSKKDADTMAIKLFNKKIQEDNRVENVLFPIRDGLMVMRVL